MIHEEPAGASPEGSQPRPLEPLLAAERSLLAVHILIASLETDIRSRLVPTIERRRVELQELRRKLTDARQHQLDRERSAAMGDLEERLAQQVHDLNTLRAAHRLACDEVAALRSSASWRLTAPARRICELLLRFRPRDKT